MAGAGLVRGAGLPAVGDPLVAGSFASHPPTLKHQFFILNEADN